MFSVASIQVKHWQWQVDLVSVQLRYACVAWRPEALGNPALFTLPCYFQNCAMPSLSNLKKAELPAGRIGLEKRGEELLIFLRSRVCSKILPTVIYSVIGAPVLNTLPEQQTADITVRFIQLSPGPNENIPNTGIHCWNLKKGKLIRWGGMHNRK